MTANTEVGTGVPAPRKNNLVPKVIFAGVVIALVIGGGAYWLATRGTESTDDAYTDGRTATIAPKVAGYVRTLNISDNSHVKAGQVLLEIDQRDYLTAQAKARATLAFNQAQLDAERVQLTIAEVKYPADLASARAAVEAARGQLTRAHADHERQRRVDQRATTEAQIDAATQGEVNAQAQLADAQAKLRTAELVQDNIAAVAAQVRQLEAEVAAARADLEQSDINLGYTRLTAPFDGWVTKRNVEQGSYVQVGQSLFSLVSPDVWVTANFKEAQLADMRPGQKVKIAIDAFPNLKVEGHVDSIQMGSGSRFTAFPAENATGNYVKIVQRVPVKIVIDTGINKDQALPLGLSVVPTVTTK
jgi:membrane fusion protein (multidrug efflux system)